MLKKVVTGAAGAAKDRLKQHRQQHGSGARHGPRNGPGARHKSGPSSAAVSLSAVDNAAFEQLLDDDTDFLCETDNHTHSSTALSGPGSADKSQVTSQREPVGLFDADMFLCEEEDSAEEEEAMRNCDPLSGQLMAEENTDRQQTEEEGGERAEFTSTSDCLLNGNGGVVGNGGLGNEEPENGKLECKGVETEGPGNGDPENGKSENGELSSSSSDIPKERNEDGVAGVGGVAGVKVQADESCTPQAGPTTEEDGLFNIDPFLSQTAPVTGAMETTPTVPIATSEENTHERHPSIPSERGRSHSESGQGLDEDTELFMSVSSEPVVRDQLTTHSSGDDSPPLFSQDHRHLPTKGCGKGSGSIKRQSSSLEENSHVGIESELEELLSSPKKTVAGVARLEESKEEPQVEREVSGHLDSGVFDHCGGAESEGSPDRDDSRTQHVSPVVTGEKLFVEENYFSSSLGPSPPQPVPVRKQGDHTHLLHHTSPTSSPRETTDSSVDPIKVTPPPRLPPPSPDASRRTLGSRQYNSTHDKKHAPRSPLSKHRSLHQSSRRTPARERIVADDLFTLDKKKKSARHKNSESGKTEVTKDEKLDREELVLKEDSQSSVLTSEISGREDGSTLYLTLPYHLLLSVFLYWYYSLNVFPYLAGLFAGFFSLFLCLGSVFIYYVHFIEKDTNNDKQQEALRSKLSDDFLQTMAVDFNKLRQYQSNNFMATLKYDHTSHHPKNCVKAELKLQEDFKFSIELEQSEEEMAALVDVVDMRQCKVTLEPSDVAQNRKRRWSKKFPIVVTTTKPNPNPYRMKTVYLFSPTAREKQEWFTRLRSASNGVTSEELIKQQRCFFEYMRKYFPTEMLRNISLDPPRVRARPSSKRSSSNHPSGHTSKKAGQQKSLNDTFVQFSKGVDTDEFSDDAESGGVNITRHGNTHNSRLATDSSSLTPPTSRRRSPRPVRSNLHQDKSEVADYPRPGSGEQPRPPLPPSVDLWLNSVAARLCWDVWHEQRWKDWIMTRIQKKLMKVKTPSFIEKLQLIDIDVGNDMPMVKGLVGGPRLDLKGIWIYLDVAYRGKFVMTIETKMKLTSDKEGEQQLLEDATQMTPLHSTKENSGLPMDSPLHGKSGGSLNHTRAAKALGSGRGLIKTDEDDEIDSGSDFEDHQVPHPLMEEALAEAREMASQESEISLPLDPSLSGGQMPANKGKFKSMMYSMAKKVTNTKFYQRAVEKFSSYSLVLTVEVMQLDGILAVNIPPPPTDTVWWGFHGKPNLDLVAKPRLGQREVKLSKVTRWIERKLCDIVNKKLVLPEMEDLVVPILNSGMPEDKQRPISSESTSSAVTSNVRVS